MNGSGKRADLSKLWNMRMAIVEVGIAETNDEAWLRHLTIHPEDLYANIRIFNRQKIAQEQKDLEIKAPEAVAKVGKYQINSEVKL